MAKCVVVATVAGEPVYWRGEQRWCGDPAHAVVFQTEKDAEDVLARARVVCSGATIERVKEKP